MFEYLLDVFQPRARHIVPLSFSVSCNQDYPTLCNPEKINYTGASAFPFALRCPAQLSASSGSRNNITGFRMITEKSLKSEKLGVGKKSVSQLIKGRQFYKIPKHVKVYGNAVYKVKKEVMSSGMKRIKLFPFLYNNHHMKRITILGSTGSIGQSTLDVISRNPSEFRAVALVAGRNISLLEDQIKAFKPEVVAVADEAMAEKLAMRVSGTRILFGPDGINQAAAHESADLVISAIVGAAGLLPTLTAIRACKHIGLANKEALVMAGSIVMAEAKRNGIRIIPVDSEHSAVYQCLEGRKKEDVRRIVLTASGGPFVNRTKHELDHLTAEEALKHPNWSMGRKISIDSATLMNKGLEVIEACWLFDIAPDLVDVLIHPQSIVHSMVEFRDRTFLAQMSMPDMRAPIAYALSYPERLEVPLQGLELDRIGQLTFRKPDCDSFPCLTYAYDAIRQAGTAPAVLNAANEVAVHAFLNKTIGFNDIPAVIRRTVRMHTCVTQPCLDEVIEADRWARLAAEANIKEIHL